MIHILQIGLGPLGIQIGIDIAKKSTLKTIAAVDVDTNLIDRPLKSIDARLQEEILISSSVEDAIKGLKTKPDIAIISTVSSLEKLIPQIKEVAKYNISVISTCEELSYPWELQPDFSKDLDSICKENDITCLGTGVNPGFLMDYLPSVLCSVCKEVDHVCVERVQDASTRRIPFQKKIGAGLDLKSFNEEVSKGTLRHVGLQESVYLLASSIGLKLDKVEETLVPVIASEEESSEVMKILRGNARGVQQVAYGYSKGTCKIELRFKAAIGEKCSYDKISIKGVPSFTSEIDGGIHGDIATSAITINSINSVLKASKGLKTMADIAFPGCVF